MKPLLNYMVKAASRIGEEVMPLPFARIAHKPT